MCGEAPLHITAIGFKEFYSQIPTAFDKRENNCAACTFILGKLARINLKGFTILQTRKTKI